MSFIRNCKAVNVIQKQNTNCKKIGINHMNFKRSCSATSQFVG